MFKSIIIILFFTARIASAEVWIPLRAELDGRETVVVNKLPAGYTLMVTSESDNITNGTYGGGTELVFDASNKVKEFRLKDHYYITGGHGHIENADFGDYIDAEIIAPATVGITAGGCANANKAEIIPSSGRHMLIPAANGAFCVSLTATENAYVSILKAVPVPAAAGDGWYDYNMKANTISACAAQNCGYNLYDFPVSVFKFARKMRIPKSGSFVFDGSEIPAKAMAPQWIIKFTFTGNNANFKAAINLAVGVEAN